MVDLALRGELLVRADRDQAVRAAAPADQPWPDEVAERCRVVDADNTAFLRSVIEARGWPGRDLVDAEGAEAAWLLCQHADADPAFQRRCLELLVEAVAAGQAEPRRLAYLTDRVRVAEGRPQVYGTQYRRVGAGPFGPAPIEDPDRLDARRAQMGLGPFADHDRLMRESYG